MSDAVVDLTDFEVWLAEMRESHRAGGLGSGRFARLPRGPLDGLSCADFAIIDYTTGPWPLAPSEQEARVAVLQQFQSLETGLFSQDAPPTQKGSATQEKARLEPWAGTAHFVAALELLGARPLLPIRAFDKLRTPAGMEQMLGGLDWSDPAQASKGASAAACLAVTCDVGPEWFDRFFAWLDRESDPSTGLWRRGVKMTPPDALTAAFRYLVLYERFRRPLPRASAILKTALELQGPEGLYSSQGPGWLELYAVFAADRAFRQCGQGYARLRAALQGLTRAISSRLADAQFRARLEGDPHSVCGLVSLLAVLSEAMPGSVKSRCPLRFFLARHLFV